MLRAFWHQMCLKTLSSSLLIVLLQMCPVNCDSPPWIWAEILKPQLTAGEAAKCVKKQSWSFDGKSENEILKAPEGELISPAGRLILFRQLPSELLTRQQANTIHWQLYWIIWGFKTSLCDFWHKSVLLNWAADSPRTSPSRKSKIVLAAFSHLSMCC